jgi:hypothetical protein
LYRVDAAVLTTEEVAAWLDYAHSNQEVIATINSRKSGFNLSNVYGELAVIAADEILGGRLDLGPRGATEISWPFDPEDLFPDQFSLHLPLAGLIIGEILLEAYIYSSESKYLHAAAAYTLALIDYERSLWLPRGLIRNDHAIAARTTFLTRLVSEVANQPDTDQNKIKKFLESIDRYVSLLSKPSFYTYRSNHGLMQSLAVMHAAIFAPSLPAVKANLQKVFERTDLQLQYLVSENGIITEHSPGYQGFDLALVAEVLQYASILEFPIPDHWIERYRRAEMFYGHMRRPDGTLPRYGDTGGTHVDILGAVINEVGAPIELERIDVAHFREPLWLDADFGYWSEWRADTHTFVGWADFGARVHKHANELSLIFWWEGQEWWTAGGYWPWGSEFRSLGISWHGSNAPHVVGEHGDSNRASNIVNWYSDSDFGLLHLKRSAPSGSFIHRTVIRLFDDYWIVLDGLDKQSIGSLESVWPTMSHIDLDISDSVEDEFSLRARRMPANLSGRALAGPGATHVWRRGNQAPFAGWTTEGGTVKETWALVLTSPPGSWHGVAWQNNANQNSTAETIIENVVWTSPDQWTIMISSDEGNLELARESDRIIMKTLLGKTHISLRTPDYSTAKQSAELAYSRMQKSSTRTNQSLSLRLKIFKLALIAGACQLGLLLLVLRFFNYQSNQWLSALTALFIAHISFGVWLHSVYFAST